MGKASGTLIVAQPLDSEQKSNYNLTVEATDGTRTVTTQVIAALMLARSSPPAGTASADNQDVGTC